MEVVNQASRLQMQQEVQLRFLSSDDLPVIKQLCAEWFPIEYPEAWFQDITSNPKFYSLAATYHGRIIGMIVCEVKSRTRCNREDQDVLASYFPPSTQVAYILSLGVVAEYRKNGVASLLLDNLLSYLTSNELHDCKAVYLHVLTTNTVAIQFYERRNFELHHFLPFYYSIKGCPRDGYSYVLYINGGQPPWNLSDFLKFVGSAVARIQPCSLPRMFLKTFQSFWHKLGLSKKSNHQVL